MNTPCQDWVGPTIKARNTRYGYPSINGKHVLAHRQAWENYHGRKIARGKVVRHRCNNSLCINPLHLVQGTQKDNVMDMVKAGNHGNSVKSAISCRKGHPRTPENSQEYWRWRNGKWWLERRCRVCRRA